jgi:SAM-dependent methyltransferase
MDEHVTHHDGADITVMYTQEFWDERYRSAASLWSGNPNPQLVEHVADLEPGRALDVGSGEGADAIWLASGGWRVTGVDVSSVALARAAERAAAVSAEAAAQITWQRVDALAWEPPPLTYDLVSAQFLQLPSAVRQQVHRRLAAAVRPGGTLLIVGHHPSDLRTSMPRPHAPDLFSTAEDVAAVLDPADWWVMVAGAPERQVVDPEGRRVAIRDAVLKARRRR